MSMRYCNLHYMYAYKIPQRFRGITGILLVIHEFPNGWDLAEENIQIQQVQCWPN